MKLLVAALCILLIACKQNPGKRLYETNDKLTGGFNKFALKLKENGQASVFLQTTHTLSMDSAGNKVEKPTLILNGSWEDRDNNIAYQFAGQDLDLEKFIDNSDYRSEFRSKELLLFSADKDTVYIFGIPAILKKG